MKMISLPLLAILSTSAGAGVSTSVVQSVSLTQDPLVMRLSKDEFRIAFGINGERCGANGCSGTIHYRVEWKAPDGASRSEIRHVDYKVAPNAGRTIAVDRQYLDTAEGQHTTEVVNVHVDAISCNEGAADTRERSGT
jgi:hypothetical protein